MKYNKIGIIESPGNSTPSIRLLSVYGVVCEYAIEFRDLSGTDMSALAI
jgi:hypothetical protein